LAITGVKTILQTRYDHTSVLHINSKGEKKIFIFGGKSTNDEVPFYVYNIKCMESSSFIVMNNDNHLLYSS
jgi:hypothetical protein